MPESAVVDGETLTLTYGEALQETAPAPASNKGQVYLAVVSEPGARRNIETARPSAVEVKGRQVILTLDPPADFGDTVTLSYYPEQRHGGEPGPRSGRQPGRRLCRAAGAQRNARGQYRPELRLHRAREDVHDRRHDRDRVDLRGSGDRERDGRRAHPGA